MTTRKYSSISQETTLTSALSSSATTMVVSSSLGLLGGITLANTSPLETFVVVIDPDTALEEIVEVTYPSSSASNTLTIFRGVDGSSAIAHSAGAAIRHMAIGRDLREANSHIEASTNVHGLAVSSSVVGTNDTQTLANKTLTTPTIASFTNANHNHTNAAGGGTLTSAAVTDFTEAAQDAAAAALAAGTQSGITVTYNDAANSISLNVNDPVITLTGDVTGSATMTDLGNTTITTAIPAGTIVDADVNATAGIAKTKIAGTAITAADTGTVTSTMIADGTIVNADINSSAQIAYSKTNLTNSIVNADINASAAIDWTKIAPSSTVSATELGYLDGVTSAIQTQLDAKLGTSTAASTYAPLASPALTGIPTAPTATAGTNTTQVATTAFVKTAVDNVVAAAPGALDTLNELASALGNDANFSTTVTNSLATKLPLAGGTMSGAIAMGTNKITGLGNPTTNQDAATKYYVDNVTVAPSNLTGPITSVGNVTSVASQTGTGSTFVMNTSPTLVTPVLGVATATSINGTTIPTSKTLVATDSTTYVVPSQTGNAGKFLTTDGTTSSWGTPTDSTKVSKSGGDTITASAAGVIPLVLKGTTAQSANLFEVQDTSATKLLIVDSTGKTVIGNSTAPTNITRTNESLMISTDTAVGYQLIARKSNSGNNPANIGFAKSRGTSASPTTVLSGDGIGNLVYSAFDGTNYIVSSQIATFTEGTISTGIVPTMMLFYTTNSVGTLTERMRIDSAGLIGINGFGFASQLTIVNSVAANAGVIIKGAASQTGDLLQVQNSAATVLATVTSAGNVGIGTTSPVVKLQIGSQSNPGGGSNTANYINIWGDYYNANGVIGGIKFFNTDGNSASATPYQIAEFDAARDNNNYGGAFYLKTADTSGVLTERMRIDSSGNVGIGKTGPTRLLNLSGSNPTIRTEDTGANGAVLDINVTNTLVTFDATAFTSAVQSMAFKTGNAERMRIDSSGNTTINSIAAGTTSTAAVGGGYMGLPQNSTTTGAYTVVAADAGKHIYSTATRTVTIDSNANLALPVGTTLTFISGVGATTTIAITTDTMYLAGTGTTGSRTLAAYGMATAVKIASTTWIISGNGLT